MAFGFAALVGMSLPCCPHLEGMDETYGVDESMGGESDIFRRCLLDTTSLQTFGEKKAQRLFSQRGGAQHISPEQ